MVWASVSTCWVLQNREISCECGRLGEANGSVPIGRYHCASDTRALISLALKVRWYSPLSHSMGGPITRFSSK